MQGAVGAQAGLSHGRCNRQSVTADRPHGTTQAHAARGREMDANPDEKLALPLTTLAFAANATRSYAKTSSEMFSEVALTGEANRECDVAKRHLCEN